jgi:hypothetical protein
MDEAHMEQDRDDPAADMEMTTNEAAAYLSGPVGFTLSAKLVRDLRYLDRGPVVEKRGSRLVYRKSALDAFLTEYGTTPICGPRVPGGRLLSSYARPETQALAI